VTNVEAKSKEAIMRLFRTAVLILAAACMTMFVSCSSKTNTAADTNTKAASGPTLQADKTDYTRGETITLKFSGIERPYQQDWISLYPVGEKNENYGEWFYLGAKSSGTLTFKTPSHAGDYEFRLFLDWPAGGYDDVARSAAIHVAEK